MQELTPDPPADHLIPQLVTPQECLEKKGSCSSSMTNHIKRTKPCFELVKPLSGQDYNDTTIDEKKKNGTKNREDKLGILTPM
jgi:hypothetical protein